MRTAVSNVLTPRGRVSDRGTQGLLSGRQGAGRFSHRRRRRNPDGSCGSTEAAAVSGGRFLGTPLG